MIFGLSLKLVPSTKNLSKKQSKKSVKKITKRISQKRYFRRTIVRSLAARNSNDFGLRKVVIEGMARQLPSKPRFCLVLVF